MCSIRQAVFCIVVTSGRVAIGQSVDQVPVVSVRLGPPANALPQVAAEVALLEGARTNLETSQLQDLDLAFASAMKHTSSTVEKVVNSALGSLKKRRAQTSEPRRRGDKLAMSFLGVDGARVGNAIGAAATQSLAIEVLPLHEPDVAIHSKLDLIEQKRSADEASLFQQAIREFAALEAIFASEVSTQLNAQADGLTTHNAVGFLQLAKSDDRSGSVDLSPNFNVRLSASKEPFPTVEGLALAMEDRRDASEEVVKHRVLELEWKFFEAANDLLHEALRAGMAGTA